MTQFHEGRRWIEWAMKSPSMATEELPCSVCPPDRPRWPVTPLAKKAVVRRRWSCARAWQAPPNSSSWFGKLRKTRTRLLKNTRAAIHSADFISFWPQVPILQLSSMPSKPTSQAQYSKWALKMSTRLITRHWENTKKSIKWLLVLQRSFWRPPWPRQSGRGHWRSSCQCSMSL